MLAQEALGDRLRREAREAVQNAEGSLQGALQTHLFDLPEGERPTDNDVITLIAEFVRTAGQRLEARHAAEFLANADWDLERAFERYMQERYSDSPEPRPARLATSEQAEELLGAAEGGTAPRAESGEDTEEESEVRLKSPKAGDNTDNPLGRGGQSKPPVPYGPTESQRRQDSSGQGATG